MADKPRTQEILAKLHVSLEGILNKLPVAHLKELVKENNNLHHINITQDKPAIVKDLLIHYKRDKIIVQKHKELTDRLKTVRAPGRPKMTELEKEKKRYDKKKNELSEHEEMLKYINESRPELTRESERQR